jgi:cytochrome P450
MGNQIHLLQREAVTPPQELAADKIADPYPYYAWLRDHAPAYREVTSRGTVVWQVTRYDDVQGLLADDRLEKGCASTAPSAGPAGLQRNLVHSDPSDHTRLRRLVNRAFVPARVAALRPLIEETARGLAARLPDGRDGQADLIADFAAPLAFGMIRTVLGVPDHLDVPGLRGMLLESAASKPTNAQDMEARLHRYLTSLVEAKRRDRADAAGDLLSVLIDARDRDGALSEEELISTAYILLLVGHDTTVNLIGNGMLALIGDPGQQELLRARPDLAESAVEELLRFDAPVRTATFRATAEPVTVAGQLIPAGDVVSLVIASANRDPARFADPDVLDLTRSPNDHLPLGRGRHFCVGAALARLEAQIAFPLLLSRLPGLRLAVPPRQLRWRATPVMRGLESLPVRFGVD